MKYAKQNSNVCEYRFKWHWYLDGRRAFPEMYIYCCKKIIMWQWSQSLIWRVLRKKIKQDHTKWNQFKQYQKRQHQVIHYTAIVPKVIIKNKTIETLVTALNKAMFFHSAVYGENVIRKTKQFHAVRYIHKISARNLLVIRDTLDILTLDNMHNWFLSG